MDREALIEMIRRGPVRITMNDGQAFDVANSEMATVGDLTAAVLIRGGDGRMRHMILPLVTMTTVQPLPAGS